MWFWWYLVEKKIMLRPTLDNGNERKCWIRNHWVSVMKHEAFVLFILINEHHRNCTLEIYAYFFFHHKTKKEHRILKWQAIDGVIWCMKIIREKQRQSLRQQKWQIPKLFLDSFAYFTTNKTEHKPECQLL